MPDNFVQQPENTQNYNRYAYVLNNPLRYTDPSGEYGLRVAVVIGVAIAAVSYTMTALLADVPFTFGGLCGAMVVGAATACVTFGIGTAAGSMFTSMTNCTMQQVAQGAFQAVAHGTFQGIVAGVQGGNFWNGFAAGALSSLAASSFGFDMDARSDATLGWGNSIRSSSAGMIAFGTVSGGAGAAMSGGNFWQGAVTGLVVSGLNHYVHKIQERKDLIKILKEKGGYTDKTIHDAIKYDEAELKLMIQKCFSVEFAQIGSPSVALEPGIKGADAKSHIEYTQDSPDCIRENSAKILGIGFHNKAFSSALNLGSTILHEFNHCMNALNGTYINWFNNRGEIWADNKDEFDCTQLEVNINGTPNVRNYIYLRTWLDKNP